MEDAQLLVIDWNGGRGGPEIQVPRSNLMILAGNDEHTNVVVGNVFGTDSAGLGSGSDDVVAELVGTAKRVRLTRDHGRLQLDGEALDLSALGLQPEDLGAVARADFWALTVPGSGFGHFADATAIIASWRAELAAKERKAREAFRVSTFFNPYNFVPLPEAAAPRATPPGHEARTAESLSGRISLTLTATSPLLIRTGSGEDPPRRSGQPIIPASALKGSVRSLHETLTGSCYRVVDLDFAPGYRDLLSAGNKAEAAGWRMGVVSQVDGDGKPTQFQLCSEVAWTQFSVVQRAYGTTSVRSGDRIRIAGRPTRNPAKGNRLEIRDGSSQCQVTRDPAGDWVILAAAVKPKGDHHYFFAAGHLANTLVAARGETWDGAWAEYLAAVDMSDDLRGRGGGQPPHNLNALHVVVHPRGPGNPQTPFYRLKATDVFAPGYVMWVRLESSEIAGLSLSQTWRHSGRGTVGARVPKDLQACQDAASLCPSCSLFGAAPSARSVRVDGKAPAAYRGHVRFFDAIAESATVSDVVDLAPMLGPKPSAGNFYLEHPKELPTKRAAQGAPSLREWGSGLDQPEPRPIRGRKYYWHTSPRSAHPRHLADGHAGPDNQGGVATSARLIEAGATFPVEIVFEGLSRAALGGLLVALDPALGLPVDAGRTACWHVGGGRPLGLGSVRPRQSIDTPACIVAVEPPGGGRYRMDEPSVWTPAQMDEAVLEFTATIPTAVREATWQSLARLLTLDWVSPENVRYPSTSPWPAGNDGRPDWSGRQALAWWKPSGGPSPDQPGFEQAGSATYVRLPRADEPVPRLPIDPLQGE